jgi:hypothetical protein
MVIVIVTSSTTCTITISKTLTTVLSANFKMLDAVFRNLFNGKRKQTAATIPKCFLTIGVIIIAFLVFCQRYFDFAEVGKIETSVKNNSFRHRSRHP